MANADDVETISKSTAEVKSGVQLRPGHKTIIILDDGKGTPLPAPPDDPEEPDEPTPPASEDPPEEPDEPEDPAEPEAPEDPPEAPEDPAEPDEPPHEDPPPAPTPAPDPVKPDEPRPPATPSARGDFGAAHFETDKSFPLPTALETFKKVAAFANKEPNRILLVVGHTDTTGTPSHNLSLSDERAKSIAAYLRNDTAAWMKMFDAGTTGKKWGMREDMHMLHALPFGAKKPYYAREPGGAINKDFEKAIRDFQKAKKQPETGTMDRKTREVLVKEYMAAEGTTVPAGMQVRTLACGQRHLADPTTGDVPENRRIDVFAFEKAPIKPDPGQCSGGKHPGCTVYDEWTKAVKGDI